MKLSAVALAALGAALLSAVPAHAQSEIIRTQLDSAVSHMRAQGFVPADAPVGGRLAQGADEEFELEIEAGTTYFVVGVCDGGCSDLDLVLTDASGKEVDSDRELDDVPMLALQGLRGTHVLSVAMATCGSAACEYGVRVFRDQ